MTVLRKLATIKNELRQRDIKKSGENKYAKFRYHELADLLPHIVELNEKHGVDTTIDITVEAATLRIYNVDEPSDFKEVSIPYAQAEMLAKGGEKSLVDAIQRMGATITYLRRYLFMTAYDIVEAEIIDKEQNVDAENADVFKGQVTKMIEKATGDKDLRRKIARRILDEKQVETWAELKVEMFETPIEMIKFAEEIIKELNTEGLKV